jgi:hypothetical protein
MPAALAVVLFAATSSSSAMTTPASSATPLELPPDAVREIAEIQAHEAEHHDPENLYAMAVLREKLGHWNEATALYRGYTRETKDSGPHAFEANAGIDRIEHAAGFLKVRADMGYDRQVWLDGRAQMSTAPVTLIVPPGKHEVAGSGGAGTIRRVVEVQTKQLVEVWIGPGDPPYPPARPIGCTACVVGAGGGGLGVGDGAGPRVGTTLGAGVGLGVAVLALARRRRSK